LTRHATQTQKITSYAKSEQLTTQKGTGDKYHETVDIHTQHALQSQKIASYGKPENLGHQKGDVPLIAQQSAPAVNYEAAGYAEQPAEYSEQPAEYANEYGEYAEQPAEYAEEYQ